MKETLDNDEAFVLAFRNKVVDGLRTALRSVPVPKSLPAVDVSIAYIMGAHEMAVIVSMASEMTKAQFLDQADRAWERVAERQRQMEGDDGKRH